MEDTKQHVQAEQPCIYSRDLIEVVYSNPYCRIRFLEDARVAKRQTAKARCAKYLESVKAGREVCSLNPGLRG